MSRHVLVTIVPWIQMVSSGIVTSLTKETQSQCVIFVGVDVGGNKVGVGEAVTVGEGGGVSVGVDICVCMASVVEADWVNIASNV